MRAIRWWCRLCCRCRFPGSLPSRARRRGLRTWRDAPGCSGCPLAAESRCVVATEDHLIATRTHGNLVWNLSSLSNTWSPSVCCLDNPRRLESHFTNQMQWDLCTLSAARPRVSRHVINSARVGGGGGLFSRGGGPGQQWHVHDYVRLPGFQPRSAGAYVLGIPVMSQDKLTMSNADMAHLPACWLQLVVFREAICAYRNAHWIVTPSWNRNTSRSKQTPVSAQQWIPVASSLSWSFQLSCKGKWMFVPL